MSTFPFIYFNKYKSEKVTLNDYGMDMDDRHYFTHILFLQKLFETFKVESLLVFNLFSMRIKSIFFNSMWTPKWVLQCNMY